MPCPLPPVETLAPRSSPWDERRPLDPLNKPSPPQPRGLSPKERREDPGCRGQVACLPMLPERQRHRGFKVCGALMMQHPRLPTHPSSEGYCDRGQGRLG